MKQIKTTASAVAIATIVFGFLQLFMYICGVYNPNAVLPLRGVNAMFVDDSGYIYVGMKDAFRIQVYNNNGEHLYTNRINTLGLFWFYVTPQGEVSVYAVRGDVQYTFKNGVLTSTEPCPEAWQKQIMSSYEETMRQFQSDVVFRDGENNTYIVRENQVYVSWRGETDYERIKLDSPFFPLNFFYCWILVVIGVCTLLIVHKKHFKFT